MSILFTERTSDSPYIETITWGRTISADSTVRPAEMNWHMVFLRYEGNTETFVVGPLDTSGIVSYGGGGELIWVRFKLGTFMPHLPVRNLLNKEITLPGASSGSFWLKGAAWQRPHQDDVETFVNRMVHDDILVRDPVVSAALQDHLPETPSRTVRHRFLQSTGLTRNYIRQMERAQRASALLRQGTPILDVVYELGYFDQPHLTKALKRFVGRTPAQEFASSCQKG